MTVFMGQDKPPIEDILEHHGIKGMKWGVRKDRENSSNTFSEKSPLLTDHQKEVAKKVAITAGVIAAVAGASYIAYTMNKSGSLPLSKVTDSSRIANAGESVARKIVEEPSDILHATRGKNRGFTFLKDGNVANPILEFEKSFGVDSETKDAFEKIDGKVIATFLDPAGRKDFAGRAIPHHVVVPKSMSEGIDSLDDVKNKIYPNLRAAAEALDIPKEGGGDIWQRS